jgi:hypothetical protein
MDVTGLFQHRRIRTFASKEKAGKERLGILSNRMISRRGMIEKTLNPEIFPLSSRMTDRLF